MRAVQFGKPPFGRRGYDEIEVDDFLRKVTDALSQTRGVPQLDPEEVHQVAFRKPRIGSRGYDEDEVDAFLDLVEASCAGAPAPRGRQELAGPASGPGGGYGPPPGMVGLGGGPGPVAAPAGPAVRAVTVALLADRGRMLVTELPDPVSRPDGLPARRAARSTSASAGTRRSAGRCGRSSASSCRRCGRWRRWRASTASPAARRTSWCWSTRWRPPTRRCWAQSRLRSRRGDLTAIWAPVDMFRRNEAQLLPEGLLPLLG